MAHPDAGSGCAPPFAKIDAAPHSTCGSSGSDAMQSQKSPATPWRRGVIMRLAHMCPDLWADKFYQELVHYDPLWIAWCAIGKSYICRGGPFSEAAATRVSFGCGPESAALSPGALNWETDHMLSAPLGLLFRSGTGRAVFRIRAIRHVQN